MKYKITPMGAPRQTQRDKWKQRPVVVRYHKYHDALRDALPGYEMGLSLNLIFHLPMPASWSKRKRAEYAGKLHDQKPDADNLAKGFMDAFGEDKRVAILHVEKYWADDNDDHGWMEVL